MAISTLSLQLTLANTLKKLRADLEGDYGERLVNVILFGSQGRGEATLLRNIRREGVLL
jgi:hypothetical protein